MKNGSPSPPRAPPLPSQNFYRGPCRASWPLGLCPSSRPPAAWKNGCQTAARHERRREGRSSVVPDDDRKVKSRAAMARLLLLRYREIRTKGAGIRPPCALAATPGHGGQPKDGATAQPLVPFPSPPACPPSILETGRCLAATLLGAVQTQKIRFGQGGQALVRHGRQPAPFAQHMAQILPVQHVPQPGLPVAHVAH